MQETDKKKVIDQETVETLRKDMRNASSTVSPPITIVQ